MKTFSLNIVHLFGRTMNIYGDVGNIIALRKRCEWRGIETTYTQVNSVKDFSLIGTGDLYFFGGGQDKDQMLVWKEISQDKEGFANRITEEVEKNKVFLLICGGYQMFGTYFIDANGELIPGLNILNIETRSPGSSVSERCIGNIVVETTLPLAPQTLVGFENHGGQTIFSKTDPATHPLGRVIKGYGNNLKDKQEGCVYKNIVGSYMHGSLLPKNPHLADYLISQALKTKYGEEVVLASLDDRLEWEAHTAALSL